jgi:AcrR family transcriptional regulator
MTAKPSASRQQRAIATRERLLRAARAAFASKGYDGTHLVADVLEPAGVSAGSFYHQFRSKADLYAAVMTEAAGDWQSPFDMIATAAGPVSIPEVVRQSFAKVFDMVDSNEDLVRIQHRDRDHPDPDVSRPLRALRDGWVDTLTTAYQGMTPDPAAAAELVVALVVGVVNLYIDIPKRRRPAARERLVDNLTTFTIGGFLALSYKSPI